jgi:flagellar P-ring protein precursor FlgI
VLFFLLVPGLAHADRVKDIASVSGVRSNQLVGYGLVVGLDGTGDQTTQAPFTVQSLKSMLSRFGITLPPTASLQLKNVAAVSVHADLPAFYKRGQTLDVTVSSLGNAKSLRGGTLLMTPLRGIDGQIYAIAQGNVIVGGLGIAAADGTKITINVPSAGRVPNGATVEQEVASSFASGDAIVLNLHRPDFTTSQRLADAINERLRTDAARALDGSSVSVRAPAESAERVAFVAELENLAVEPGEAPARVIVNARTGTVVIGQHVRVSAAAVTHGSLSVTIREQFLVSQPAPYSFRGETEVVPESDIEIEQGTSHMFLFEPGVTLGEIVRAVNQVGAAPQDLVSILEALKMADALHAELVVI